MARNINKAGIDLLKSFEGCMLIAYKDTVGVWTIGWGATYYQDGTKVKKGDTITQLKADELLLFHLQKYVKETDSLITSNVNDNQFSACVVFAYNVGTDIDTDKIPEGFGDSTLLKKINANPNDLSIRNEFLKWNKAGGKTSKGLTRRRIAEANLYFTK